MPFFGELDDSGGQVTSLIIDSSIYIIHLHPACVADCPIFVNIIMSDINLTQIVFIDIFLPLPIFTPLPHTVHLGVISSFEMKNVSNFPSFLVSFFHRV